MSLASKGYRAARAGGQSMSTSANVFVETGSTDAEEDYQRRARKEGSTLP